MSSLEIRADRVSFAYASALALDDVSARVPKGGLVGILGPNGSGKTTLLRLLTGLLVPSRGHVQIGGRDLRGLRRDVVARHVAFVPQDTQLTFEYTVLEMAVMGRYPHLGTFEVEGPEEVELAREALRATGTLHLESRPFNTLSGGEKQRVVIAAALAQLSKPRESAPAAPIFEVLLLDEPTASLDLAYQLEVRSMLQQLNAERGLTIVVSTHDLNFAAGLCRELILLRKGQLLDAGPADAMLQPDLIRALYDVDIEIAVGAVSGRRTIVPMARSGTAGLP